MFEFNVKGRTNGPNNVGASFQYEVPGRTNFSPMGSSFKHDVPGRTNFSPMGSSKISKLNVSMGKL